MDISPARASVGAVISPFLSGLIVEKTGAWFEAFYLAAGVLVVAAICAIVLLRGPLAASDSKGAVGSAA